MSAVLVHAQLSAAVVAGAAGFGAVLGWSALRWFIHVERSTDPSRAAARLDRVRAEDAKTLAALGCEFLSDADIRAILRDMGRRAARPSTQPQRPPRRPPEPRSPGATS